MAASLLATGFLHYATYHPHAPANNADWDALYVAAGLLAILLVVVLAATLANHQEDRRHSRSH